MVSSTMSTSVTPKKILTIISLACSVALHPACDSPTKSEQVSSNAINFSNLQVGQTSTYISFAFTNYLGDYLPTNFYYTYDSLSVSIVSENGGYYQIVERFVDVDATDWWRRNDTTEYQIQVRSDSLWFIDTIFGGSHSRLFESFRRTALPLTPVTDVQVTLDGWRPEFPSGECCLGTLASLEILDQTWSPLNVYLVAITYDGPASWWFYSGSAGIVRHFAVNPWTRSGNGWDLLP
jgi:hypothetical protein